MPNTNPSLSVLQPEGLLKPDSGLQERRSAHTRETILEATIRCLADHGYSRTTTTLVATEARASRGAMLHHYPTRQALIAAAIEYAFYKRMKNFIAHVEALTEAERVEKNMGIPAEMRAFRTTEYKAYLELHVAARTDDELREIFLPRARKYEQVWRDEVRRAFPEWSNLGDRFDRACIFTRATVEGLILNADIWDDPEAEADVVELLSQILLMIRNGQIAIPGNTKD